MTIAISLIFWLLTAATQANILAPVEFSEDSPPGTFITSIRDKIDIPQIEMESNTFPNIASDLFAYENATLSVHSKKWVDLEQLVQNHQCTFVNRVCFVYLQIYLMTAVDSRFYSLPIGIIDVDDNAPHFKTQKFELEIQENHPNLPLLIPLPTAYDEDILDKDNLTYELRHETQADQPIFSLFNQTTLSVNKRLDREKCDLHRLALKAKSRELESVLRVVVRVKDVNDNVPECGQNQFVIGDSYTGPLGKLIAFDRDLGDNARFEMSFLNTSPSELTDEYVLINQTDNCVYVKKAMKSLAHEQFMFKFKIVDKGHPALSTICHLSIVVKPAPVLVVKPRNGLKLVGNVIYVPDFSKKADVLIELEVRENDFVENPYSIECRSDLFRYQKHSPLVNGLVLVRNLLEVKNNVDEKLVVTISRDKYPLVRKEHEFFVRLLATDAFTIAEPINKTTITLGTDFKQPILKLKTIANPKADRFTESVKWKIVSSNLNLLVAHNGSVFLRRIYRPGIASLTANLVGAMSEYQYSSVGVNVIVKPETLLELKGKLAKDSWAMDQRSGSEGFSARTYLGTISVALVILTAFGVLSVLLLPLLKRRSVILGWRKARCSSAFLTSIIENQRIRDSKAIGDDYGDSRTISSEKANPSNSFSGAANNGAIFDVFRSVDRFPLSSGGECFSESVDAIWQHINRPAVKPIIYGTTKTMLLTQKSSFV